MHTYQIDLTLEVDAVNVKQAQRLVRLVAKDIAGGHRHARCPGASGVTHAWMDLYPREIPQAQPLPHVDDVEVGRWESDGGAACAA